MYPADVLPAWVAEMDFPLAPPVREALLAAVEHDDCGYPHPEQPRRGVRRLRGRGATAGRSTPSASCSCPTW